MYRWAILTGLAVLMSGCADASQDMRYLVVGGPPADPARLVFGVSGERSASSAQSDAEMRIFLDRKANQICTLGYDTVKVDTEAAEDGKQFVDEQLRCKGYQVRLF